MVEGLTLREFKQRQQEFGAKLSDYFLGDWEGEMLLYHHAHHRETLLRYKDRYVNVNREVILSSPESGE